MQLALCTWQETEEYLRASRGTIVPMGSVEHGANGLMGADHFDAEFVARGVGDKITCMIAPTLAYGMTVFGSGGRRCHALAQGFYGDSNGCHATAAEFSLSQFSQPHFIERAQTSPKVAPKSNVLYDSAVYRRRFPDGRIGSDPSPSGPERGEQLYAGAAEDMEEIYTAFMLD
jgi:creatinine amidohydrolase/Fe(II)-dependent formamide hydrolase-like protein